MTFCFFSFSLNAFTNILLMISIYSIRQKAAFPNLIRYLYPYKRYHFVSQDPVFPRNPFHHCYRCIQIGRSFVSLVFLTHRYRYLPVAFRSPASDNLLLPADDGSIHFRERSYISNEDISLTHLQYGAAPPQLSYHPDRHRERPADVLHLPDRS